MTNDHSNPLSVSLPYAFPSPHDFPTEVLANRFQAWRSIIKDLVNYLKEYASVEEEIIRQQVRLQQAVGTATSTATNAASTTSYNSGSAPGSSSHHNSTPAHLKDDIVAINKYFLPIGNGSIQDLPTILTKFHQQNVSSASKTLKEINSLIIPKLEDLRKDLLIKIKEIKNLQNDFKTNLGKEIQETKSLLAQYRQAIELSNKLEHGISSNGAHLPGAGSIDGSSDNARFDPYLVKLKLDRQLKKQLSEENYLYDAYANLQNSGGKLESIVVLEVQSYLGMFLNLVEHEHSTIPNYLVPNINNILTKEPGFEWDSFISRHLPATSPLSNQTIGAGSSSSPKAGTFIDLSFPARKLSDLQISNFETPLNVSIREGFLERRSKFLKSYSSGWYVLTCNYLHEFKSPDRKKDPQPVMSLSLDACSVSEHSKDDGKATGGIYKFVLYSKGSNIRHRSHNWVFRSDTYKTMIEWYNDIKSLTTLATPAARARFIAKKQSSKGDGTGVPKVSRPSSIFSSGTHARTIRSGESIDTGKIAPSIRSKDTSQNQRLSSTFSHKNNNNSPRLSNMINSDGTIITPVESRNGEGAEQHNYQHQKDADDHHHDDEVHTQDQNQYNNQQHQQQQQQLPPQQQQQGYIPQDQQQQGYVPAPGAAQVPLIPGGANNFIPANGFPGYYIAGTPGQAVQSGQSSQIDPSNQAGQLGQGGQLGYYDPVRQQWYTLSSTMQPQYFPGTPQQPGQQQFYPIAAQNAQQPQPQQQQQQQPQQQQQQPQAQGQGQPQAGTPGQANQLYPINTAHYFPQSPQPQPQYNDVTSLGSYLPYPPNVMPPPTVHLNHEDYSPNTTTTAQHILSGPIQPADPGASTPSRTASPTGGDELAPSSIFAAAPNNISTDGDLLISREVEDDVETLPSIGSGKGDEK